MFVQATRLDVTGLSAVLRYVFRDFARQLSRRALLRFAGNDDDAVTLFSAIEVERYPGDFA